MSDPDDPHAAGFRRLYTAHVDQITGFALRRVLSADDAVDVVAETFLVAWRRRRGLPQDDEALLWLYGVARRVLANHRRGIARRERLAARLASQMGGQLRGALAASSSPDPADTLVEVHAVRAAMARLSDVDRELLRLSAWERLEPREIAVVLGIAPTAVRTRLTRARTRLRRELDDEPHHVYAGLRPALVSEEDR